MEQYKIYMDSVYLYNSQNKQGPSHQNHEFLCILDGSASVLSRYRIGRNLPRIRDIGVKQY
jgi:hypothetical protein